MPPPREYQTEAVIIRKTRLGEADRIITLYTPGLGKLQAVAKAVRKTKSKLSGHLELLTYSQVTLARGRNLDTIIGSQAINSFLPLRNSLEATSAGLYLAEMISLFTAEADRIDNHKLFKLLVSSLEKLNQGSACHTCLRYFEVQLLGYTGFRPQLKVCTICRQPLEPVTNTFSPGAGGVICERCAKNQALPYSISVNGLKVLRLFQDCAFSTALRLKLSAELNLELERLLRSYCRYILEREIKSTSWLDTLKTFNTNK
ncbi:MAG: DNA repair protein RecO [Dehalococcoidales bacterium]|nr:DNA repair protein RecO [Dehalococcoidales bacterium]MDD4322412.1 DNA repair protein RecO [Dehalococcoidales bacterium]MDD4794124.1 DNA repair protein RecO [Dehalococcoidales bacterium]MDD5122940.1 DNA repair protein RecO [Dehalococcoidales bacterium]MDD5498576.1 DNA repair protein RecO [Dehalococcoidales bacterium]